VHTQTQTKESSPSAILTAGELDQIQDLVTQTRVGNTIQQYLVALATASRNHPDIDAGLSPRGLLLWQRAAQATAQLAGRDFVTPDDVQQVAFPVLAVRLDVEAADSRNLISQLLESVDVPTAPAP
jgi:MoxR-like ATPase